jgi:hypothetical protein
MISYIINSQFNNKRNSPCIRDHVHHCSFSWELEWRIWTGKFRFAGEIPVFSQTLFRIKLQSSRIQFRGGFSWSNPPKIYHNFHLHPIRPQLSGQHYFWRSIQLWSRSLLWRSFACRIWARHTCRVALALKPRQIKFIIENTSSWRGHKVGAGGLGWNSKRTYLAKWVRWRTERGRGSK